MSLPRCASLVLLVLAGSLHAGTPALFDNPPAVAPEPGWLNGLRTADFNNDGKMDFALNIGVETPKLYVHLGNGDGTFAAPVATPTYRGPFAAANLDSDSYPDVVVAYDQSFETHLQVYRGNGDGSFTVRSHIALGRYCWEPWVVLDDFTSDGRADIAACGIKILPNLGTGVFGAPITIDEQWNDRAHSLDSNGDGKRDLILEGSQAKLLLGNGNGTFYRFANVAGNPSAPADFNGDTFDDLASLEGDLAVRFSSAIGTYDTRVSGGFVTEEYYPLITTGDVNGDDRPDIIARRAAASSSGSPTRTARPVRGSSMWRGRIRARLLPPTSTPTATRTSSSRERAILTRRDW